MAWVLVVSLIVFGIGLIVMETIFVPGTTVVGVLGFIFTVVGVYQSFDKFGSGTGWYVFSVTGVLLVAAILFSFRSGSWEKFALNDQMKGRLFEGESEALTLGDEGIAVSALKPIGSGIFDDKEYEISTLGEYVDSGVRIEIVKLETNKIFVKPII